MIDKLQRFLFSPASPWSLCAVRLIFLSGFIYTLWYYGFIFEFDATQCGEVWLPVSYFKLLDGPICLTAQQAWLLSLCWKVFLVLGLVGLFTSFSLKMAFFLSLLVIPFHFNFGKIDHNSHFPVILLGILAFSRCGDFLSFDWLLAKRWGKIPSSVPSAVYSWPLQFAKIYVVAMYLSSGLQKLRHSGLHWFDPANMQVLLLTRPTLTPLGFEVALHPLLAQLSACAIIVVQVGAPIALLNPVLAVIFGSSFVLFHCMSYWLMGLHGDFFSYVWALSIWLPVNEMVKKIRS
jgi:hypothetical protein